MKKKSKVKKIAKAKLYNLLVYVEDNSTKIKKFDTAEELGEFVDNFNKEYPDYADSSSDNWTDFAITDIQGEIYFFTDGIKVE